MNAKRALGGIASDSMTCKMASRAPDIFAK
jgi:hypothetical protein